MSDMASPERISVILPVYNGEQFLAEAIQSVLDQTLLPDEIIAVDDGSTDRTALIIAEFSAKAPVPIRYAYQENQGPAAARNHGLHLAQGELIAFQDADDVWAIDRLPMQVQLLDQRPDAAMVLGRTRFFADGVSLKSVGADDATAPRWFLGMQCGIYRRAAFTAVGVFDSGLRVHDDTDWFRRAIAAGLVIHTHEDIVLYHRRHAGNITNDPAVLQSSLLRMLRKASKDYAPNSDPLWAVLTGRPLVR